MEEIKTLKDHVYSYIAEQIRTGGMHPNQRVSETAICEALKISRTPVREALIQLTAEGVLEKQNRKGFVIKMISEERLHSFTKSSALWMATPQRKPATG